MNDASLVIVVIVVIPVVRRFSAYIILSTMIPWQYSYTINSIVRVSPCQDART